MLDQSKRGPATAVGDSYERNSFSTNQGPRRIPVTLCCNCCESGDSGPGCRAYSDGTVFPATTSSTRVVGAAYLANRITHDQTDNTIAAGLYVTVVTRGVCNLTIGSGVTLAAGDIVAAYSTGRVGGSAAYGDRIGKCLVGGTGDASGTVYATVLLNI